MMRYLLAATNSPREDTSMDVPGFQRSPQGEGASMVAAAAPFLSAPDASAAAIPGRLLVHVTYHHVPSRLVHLQDLLRCVASYRFTSCEVAVDTNCGEGAEAVAKLGEEPALAGRLALRCRIHAELPHPHILTWVHRAAMRERLGDFDFFMYTEDDMAVPWPAVVAWHRDTALLTPHGLLRGFLRVEFDANGRLMSTDLHHRERPTIRRIGSRDFFHPRRPYQAFWIYDRAQMEEFVGTQSWIDPPCSWTIRAKAAAGMIFSNVPKPPPGRSRRGYSRVLLPLNERGEPAAEAFAYHLPGNYARPSDPKVRPRARIPAELVTKPPFWRSVL